MAPAACFEMESNKLTFARKQEESKQNICGRLCCIFATVKNPIVRLGTSSGLRMKLFRGFALEVK